VDARTLAAVWAAQSRPFGSGQTICVPACGAPSTQLTAGPVKWIPQILVIVESRQADTVKNGEQGEKQGTPKKAYCRAANETGLCWHTTKLIGLVEFNGR